ncbi:hypothetical protein NL108_004580 [Boleophthalmus pectinirostris]|uniref:mesoderm posterior aa n=1 Tax=Boleophthalmus pectinirostris TaxID=150288 RepID=UPI00242EF9BA|nr:mesoderm posterior aa [Boleophthalmus pectinirostris]KAJ0056312.1 hypothetical protein NL108_004580 [Boleophthalmus pectinirostris]
MDMSYCSPQQPQEDASSFLFDCDALLDKSCDPLAFDPSSDPGYFSACSSLSPTSSVDSFCFSPNLLQVKAEPEPLDCFFFSSERQQMATTTKILAKPASTTSATKKSRSRYPGKKRETASKREKLRMRDLTKALHHLRSYLPASVAPEGQTLTKIETLRFTIRYISHLSAQLGLTEEVLEKRSSGPMEPGLFTYSSLQETPCSSSLQPAGPSTYTTPVTVPAGLSYTPQQYWMP